MTRDEHRAETLRALRQLCGRVAYSHQGEPAARISLGVTALDALLPGHGVEPGSLMEWLSPVEGSGAAVLALQGVRIALRQRRVWAVIDAAGEFHPAAASGWGIDLNSLLVIRPVSVVDALWAVEQCLRCPAVGVTWFQAPHLSDRVIQRWKRAVEVGGGIGMLFRPMEASRQTSWADLRWSVQPQIEGETSGRRVCVELKSCRGCFAGGSVDLELYDATGDVRVVSVMAGATAAVRAAGA
jgi:protein ImuA